LPRDEEFDSWRIDAHLRQMIIYPLDNDEIGRQRDDTSNQHSISHGVGELKSTTKQPKVANQARAGKIIPKAPAR